MFVLEDLNANEFNGIPINTIPSLNRSDTDELEENRMYHSKYNKSSPETAYLTVTLFRLKIVVIHTTYVLRNNFINEWRQLQLKAYFV